LSSQSRSRRLNRCGAGVQRNNGIMLKRPIAQGKALTTLKSKKSESNWHVPSVEWS